MIKIKDLKVGDYFAFKVDDFEPSRVYVRGQYCRELKKYSYYPFDDVNDEHFIKGDRLVYGPEDFVF